MKSETFVLRNAYGVHLVAQMSSATTAAAIISFVRMADVDYLLQISGRAEDEDVIQGRLFLTASTGNVVERGTVVAFFDTADDRDAAAETFSDLDVDLERLERPRSDWLEHYQQSLQPLFIGSFVVAPDAKLIPADAKRSLLIPQEQAFGTGSHESTALCIELLDTLDLRGKLGLDIGSGSGILALAMRRIGARKVIAFDNDPDAYAALRENRMRNDIDAVPLFIGGIEALRGGTFDVVTMNILPDVIIALLPQVKKHLRGPLIVSGIIRERRDEVASLMRVVEERTKGEWWAAILELD
jgi:ribosomal protein L11 methyltransferase